MHDSVCGLVLPGYPTQPLDLWIVMMEGLGTLSCGRILVLLGIDELKLLIDHNG